ncbi:transcriptional regulator, LysR family [Rhizobium sp. NFR07]|uniref:LysR family transcriptional regulator n=1 Tax=Rhizobium sp. NFR07 TaxID=1566262 RepID=UPI0008EC634A|nr:LysR family transcriptional regulator [Rhizobium sp. NFR07]SFA75333.1 transcriptional regulator, LysR family [Rhizobium sp. NFR07]
MRREDIADLMAFAVIAEERSFSRAALRLGLSSSALSHAIRLLEDRLGTKLLNRTTRSVAPTAAGQRLLARLSPALGEIAEGLDALADERDRPSGMVRINTHQSAAFLHVIPKLKDLRARYPDVVLDLGIDDGMVDIVSAGFDAGIRHGRHLAKDMVAVRISPEYHSALVASPDYLRDKVLVQTPADVLKLDCLAWRSPTSGSLMKWEFLHDRQKVTLDIDPAITANDMEMIVRAAVAGAGVAYLLREQVAAHLESGRLVELLPECSVPHDACYLYYPDRRQIRPAMRAVIDLLKEGA